MGNLRSTPVDLGNNIWMIDLLEQGLRCRTAAYFIRDEKLTLIETGSSLSHDILVDALGQIDVQPTDLDYVIVTHVHLDHAGGAGHMMEKATQATLVCHPRAGRHMIDPSRLWGGAQQVYGDELPKLFGSIKAVPEARVLIRDHGETLNIGARTLTFYNSPGHAKHHFTIHDSLAHVLYAGDALGIFYPTGFTGWTYEWVMPSTSPTDFDPVAIRQTVEMLADIPFEWAYHAHFGKSPKDQAMRDTLRIGEAWAALADNLYTPTVTVESLADALRAWVVNDLRDHGFDPGFYRDGAHGGDLTVLDMDMAINAMGLLVYEQRKHAK